MDNTIISNVPATIPDKPKAKRGRRSKKEIAEMKEKEEKEKLEKQQSNEQEVEKPAPKKRGRKPKGGKIVEENIEEKIKPNIKPNVMLHLKCCTRDLNKVGNHESDFSEANINSYDENNLPYHVINNTASTDDLTNYQNILDMSTTEEQKSTMVTIDVNKTDTNTPNDNSVNTKELWKKLKNLQQILHVNSVPDSKSACFWCTYDFDNPPIYIPKFILKNIYHVYGCFCSPECAVAHLMKENIDSSSRFERYALLNNIYNKIFPYSKNIKPAPDPHYLLERFCGNISIQEYRQLMKSDRLFLVVDKPLTRILPELHEDNDEFIINNKIIPTSSNYSLKKRSKTNTKSSANGDNFGIFSMVS